MESADKGLALLRFLKDAATLRRRRVPSYGPNDRLVWFADIPSNRVECRSAFISESPSDIADLWLEVRKKRMPIRPPLPETIANWVRIDDLDHPDAEPDLLSEITVLVEQKSQSPVPESGKHEPGGEKFPEVLHLKDHPEVEDAWLEYLVDQWEPWQRELQSWREVQQVYENVDFMRRRLEESEERFELLLAVGLLQGRDRSGTLLKRHLLTAPAEINLDASRGVLTVTPAASFEKFRIELDMLEYQQQPRLEDAGLEERLDELDIEAWDKSRVGEILRIIANRSGSDAQVDEEELRPLERVRDSFNLSYAPAILLRERRPTAYEELCGKCLNLFEGTSPPPMTSPWKRFLVEGESCPASVGLDSPAESRPEIVDSRVYFPLPTNDEQLRIIERLRERPYVLVKGPPGTGKSHTIANLICHLLAMGERILVTAHAPKALAVLKDLLPPDLQHLCVTAFGASRDDHRLLEDSVRGILAQKHEWKGQAFALQRIEELEHELLGLEGERAVIDRQLRECREAETYSHVVAGMYEGTAAQIAKHIERDGEMYSWIPELSNASDCYPLSPTESNFLADVHGSLTDERLNELRLDVCNFKIPDPDAFAEAVRELRASTQEAALTREGTSEESIKALRFLPDEALTRSRAFLCDLNDHATRSFRVLGQLSVELVADVVAGSDERWARLAKEVDTVVQRMTTAIEQIGAARIELPEEVLHASLKVNVQRRLSHFSKGGWRGWRFLAPREARETRYVEQVCRVNGRVPKSRESLDALLAFTTAHELLSQFIGLWPSDADLKSANLGSAASEAALLAQELNRVLQFLQHRVPVDLSSLPTPLKARFSEAEERKVWICSIGAEIARRKVEMVTKLFDSWLVEIRIHSSIDLHPCIQQLVEALENRDIVSWKFAWESRESFKAQKKASAQYNEFVDRLEQACPGLRDVIDSVRSKPEWHKRLSALDRAWAWSGARAWLHDVLKDNQHQPLLEKHQRLQSKVERTMQELAALKAWLSFFGRLDDATEQHLMAWTKAVARIGKGTGKYAYRHRRTARQYLTACIPKMPAWIMPLYKLWETTALSPGVFDTIIVDEASQAGIESLALLLLAKNIVVVGDDKQNSPEAVGVLEDDIARLARDHLRHFRFRDEFRPDTSFFDHAERAFGNLISLREHFRCVPEIIRFSNDLCYTDAPLIPLRQAPPSRLPALRSTFVGAGSCESDGQRILNRIEAGSVVKAIEECIGNDAYEGKTMGVIVLQGHSQAEFIEKKLAEILEPKVREERKLRCGVPATFQGDQRDVVFLSLVVSPNHPYRALTALPDQRRFNVAMSRARDQMWIFHSVQQHDLSREDLRWRVLNFFSSQTFGMTEGLFEELDRLERAAIRTPRRLGNQPDPYESWFEVDVALELLRRKYRIRPQYEVAGYRIDIVVEGNDARLAVECDGDAWHGPEQYDHDLARERQLMRANWTFVRVRESEFYANRRAATEQIVAACDALEIHPMDYKAEQNNTRSPGPAEFGDQVNVQSGLGEADDEAGVDPETTCEEARNVEYGPFTGYAEARGFPDPREAPTAIVSATLRQIVETDGPLSRASVFRLYVEGCPNLHRAGKTVREGLNRSLGVLLRSGDVVQEDELGGNSPDFQIVRMANTPKVRERPAGNRDLLEIPPSELLVVLDRQDITGLEAEAGDENRLRNLLDHYGFVRLTSARRKYLLRVLNVHRQRHG